MTLLMQVARVRKKQDWEREDAKRSQLILGCGEMWLSLSNREFYIIDATLTYSTVTS
jgi:hypothetical protein